MRTIKIRHAIKETFVFQTATDEEMENFILFYFSMEELFKTLLSCLKKAIFISTVELFEEVNGKKLQRIW